MCPKIVPRILSKPHVLGMFARLGMKKLDDFFDIVNGPCGQTGSHVPINLTVPKERRFFVSLVHYGFLIPVHWAMAEEISRLL
jgi:hypothetical protein